MSVTKLKDGRLVCTYAKGKKPAKPDGTMDYFKRGPEEEAAARSLNESLSLGVHKT